MSDGIFDFAEGYRISLAAMAGATQASMGEPIPFDDATPKHIVYVQLRPGGFFASCMICGCDPFPDRRTLAEAEADARAHGELRHNYPRAVLLDHEQNPGLNTQGGEMKEPTAVDSVKALAGTVEQLTQLIEGLVDLGEKGVALSPVVAAEARAVVKIANSGMASVRDIIARIEEEVQ